MRLEVTLHSLCNTMDWPTKQAVPILKNRLQFIFKGLFRKFEKTLKVLNFITVWMIYCLLLTSVNLCEPLPKMQQKKYTTKIKMRHLTIFLMQSEKLINWWNYGTKLASRDSPCLSINVVVRPLYKNIRKTSSYFLTRSNRQTSLPLPIIVTTPIMQFFLSFSQFL
jgi:hypothetical protein